MMSWLAWMMATTAAAEPASTVDPAALQRDVTTYAAKNRWTAVEVAYAELLALQPPVPPHVHLAGARAALEVGRPLLAWQRARRAEGAVGEVATSLEELRARVERRFGRVHLFVPRGEASTLVAIERPFAKADRDAIDTAAGVVAEQGVFRGLLPVGRYQLGATFFEVRAGWGRWHTIRAGESAL